MTRCSAASLDGLAYGALSTALALLAVALLVVPQRLAQRPAHQGVVALHLAADGGLRLWNRPITPEQLPQVLRESGQLNPQARIRLIPDPAAPWGVVQTVLPLLELGVLPFEVQLPAPPAQP
ncbi:biopolymer transporter ExbD [Cyanobium sp. Morenito 9A2]|uniref:ExbD/TolR family protein n=1 Tax=Cyanobium sp. Morenito 9A2 TaxID=2823718 RepID=UPI0020CB980B|nr:hypothetical protein [Cyanobium sp. Morenito 9A2]MCP9848558.1 hypothetical protein [Cyanobium sp. Morenito 9A2]